MIRRRKFRSTFDSGGSGVNSLIKEQENGIFFTAHSRLQLQGGLQIHG